MARVATERYPGLLEGAGAPGAVATKEAWKSEMVAAMTIWSAAFNNVWSDLTINFVEAPNSNDGYELPNNIALFDAYDLPHEKGIGDLRFGQHSMGGFGSDRAHTYLPNGTLGEEGTYGGDLHFNLTHYTWRQDTDSTVSGGNSMKKIGAHELGHAFGLRHTTYDSVGASLMYVGHGPPTAQNMSEFSNAIPPSDLDCLKTLYEDDTLSPDCNTAGTATSRWTKIVDAIERINAGGGAEVITITYSFYVDSPIQKLHLTANHKLCKDEETDRLKYHDHSEADLCCGTCFHCEDNKAPQSFKVTITGSVNTPGEPYPPCDHCADFDGNYIVPKQADVTCVWKTFIEDHCDRVLAYEPYIQVRIFDHLLQCTLFYGRAHPYGTNGVLTYQKELSRIPPATRPDCTEIDVTMTYTPDEVTDTVYICDVDSVVMDIIAL